MKPQLSDLGLGGCFAGQSPRRSARAKRIEWSSRDATGFIDLRGAGVWRRDAVLLSGVARGRLAVLGPLLGRRLHARF